jgi:hypothetical protein
MGKSNPFKKSQQDIRALGLANADDLKGDFKFTQNQLGAIFGNLKTSGKGIGRTLTASQQRSLDLMSQAANRGAKRSSNIVEGGAAAAKNLFGTAMGGAIDTQFDPARAVQGATRLETKGNLKAGALTAQAGQSGLAAMLAGAQEAKSGAQYAMAAALKTRTTADAAQLATAQAALDSQKLQAKLDEKAAVADAARNEAYLRLQMGGGSTGSGALADASSGLASVLEDQRAAAAKDAGAVANASGVMPAKTADPGAVAAYIAQAQIQYNLGPAETEKLYQQAGMTSAVGTDQSAISPEYTKRLNALVWTIHKKPPAGFTPDEASIKDLLNVTQDSQGNYIVGQDALTAAQWAAALSYIQTTYRRISEAAPSGG